MFVGWYKRLYIEHISCNIIYFKECFITAHKASRKIGGLTATGAHDTSRTFFLRPGEGTSDHCLASACVAKAFHTSLVTSSSVLWEQGEQKRVCLRFCWSQAHQQTDLFHNTLQHQYFISQAHSSSCVYLTLFGGTKWLWQSLTCWFGSWKKNMFFFFLNETSVDFAHQAFSGSEDTQTFLPILVCYVKPKEWRPLHQVSDRW